jgi:hypothetical protein
MQPTLIIALLSALLVATHIGMATARTRAWMVSRLGENRFVALYSAWRQLSSEYCSPTMRLIDSMAPPAWAWMRRRQFDGR